MAEHYAVIMSGGRGERFWPLSTARRPKQLLPLFQGTPLLAGAVRRLEGLVPVERTFVITHKDLVQPSAEVLPSFPRDHIIGEPMGRDTAAAVALGTALVKSRDPRAAFCVLTADHIVDDVPAFRGILRAALDRAAQGDALVTLGIPPTCPSTAFGYIEAGPVAEQRGGVTIHKAVRFVEKPDLPTATEYVRSGRYYWNSGMFIWAVPAIEAALRRFQPSLSELVNRLTPEVGRPGFPDALRRVYEPLPKISVDYAVMEKVDNLLMIPGAMRWDDVGSWSAVENHFPKDGAGNVTIGLVEAVDTADTIAVSEGRVTALFGVRGLIVVQADGVTLVCARDRAHDIKKLVAHLKSKGGFDALL